MKIFTQSLFLLLLLLFPNSATPINLPVDENDDHRPEISEEYSEDYETTTLQNDEAIPVEPEFYNILVEKRLRLCGHIDTCPDMEKIKENKSVVPGQEKLTMDYSKNPFTCRCDVEQCSVYGDCCVGLKTPVTPFLKSKSVLLGTKYNPWRCLPLQKQQPQTSALMMSECPPDAEKQTVNLCSGKVDDIPPELYTYMVDLPAYSNQTKILYKNIFCAVCNGESNSDLIKWTLKLYCNHDLSPSSRQLFFDNATYIPIEREWLSGDKTCKLVIPELENSEIEVNIPNVRYCGYNTEPDYCPPDYEDDETSILCTSYAQYVFDKVTKKQYKNPHCAICNGVADKKSLLCVRLLEITRVSPGQTGATLHGVGLNFLFDFGLGEKNSYVGYEMLCSDHEIWDYVRQKCHPMICGKDHVLKDGICVQRIATPIPIEYTNDNGKPISQVNSSMGGPAHCFRILLNSHEFEILENKSIILKLNQTGNEIEILNPEDYEYVNESMVSICAKDLHKAFPSRFSALLDYLTIVSLGLSVTFSFLHMLFFTLVPKLRNLPSQNLFCLTLCLFISQLCFLTLIRQTGKIDICIAAAITMHFFFLAAFFWMNILSWDIFRTFSTIRRPGLSANNKKNTFLKYSAYAWTIPFLIVSSAAAVDLIFADYTESGLILKIKPTYGENGLCWISQRISLFIFFAAPVAIIICLNLFLFSRTAIAILAQQKETSKVLRSEHSKASSDETRLKLYIKLALIMGLTWILGFVSGFTSWDWLWYPFVVLNGLQGTFIFFSFDFKWKVFKMVVEIFVPLGGRPIMRRRGASTSSTNATNVVSLSSSEIRTKNRVSVISNASAVNI